MIPSSLPNLLAISPLERVRTLSQTSDNSILSTNSNSNTSKPNRKKKHVAKLVSGNGIFHLDKDEVCKLLYMENYLTSDQADTLLNDLNTSILSDNDNKINIEFLASCEQKIFSSVEPSSDELCFLVTHLVDKIERAIGSLFETDVKFGRVILRKLSDGKEHIPYESFTDKDGSKDTPVLGVLSVGAPRPFSLKTVKGHKVTHQIPLHSGALCLLSGETESR